MRIFLVVILNCGLIFSHAVLGAEAGIPANPENYRPPELSASSTLDDYLLFALASNPALKASYQQWQSAVYQVPQAGVMPNPRVSYGYFLRQVETRVGPQVQRFGISQAFPWFGKLSLARGSVSSQARAAANKFEADRIELCRKVSLAWYDYWLLGKRIEITRAGITFLQQAEAIVRARYTTSGAAYSQLLKVQVELAKLEDSLCSLENLAGSRAAAFNALLGRDTALPLEFPESIDTAAILTITGDPGTVSVENNPGLARLRELQSAAEDGVRLAAKQRWPDLMVGLDYIQTDPSSMAGVGNNGKDPVIASISLELPLSLAKYGAAEKQAASNLDGLRRQEDDLRRWLLVRFKESEVNRADACRRLELYSSSLVPRASQALEAALSGLATGGADVLDVLDAQRTLLTFQLEQERSLAELAKSGAELEAVTGGSFNIDTAPGAVPGGGN